MEKKRSSKKLGASVLAILLVISMMVGMVPGGMSEVHAADAKANVKAEEQKLSRRQRWLRRLL